MASSLSTGPNSLLSWLNFWGGFSSTGMSANAFSFDYLLLWGGRYLPSIAFGGQGYLWITSLFIHQSIMHILSNMVLFLILSGYLEHQYGTLRILVIFVVSGTCDLWRLQVCFKALAGCSSSPLIPVGIAGNFSSAIFEDPCQLVVGASGCIFGLVGLYIADVILNFESLSLPWLRLGTMLVALVFVIVSQVGRRSQGREGARSQVE